MLEGSRECQYLFCLLVLICFFNVVDFFATQDLVTFGVHEEWNPLMRGLVGTPYFVLYKLVLIPLGLIFLWCMRKIIVAKYFGLIRLTCGIYTMLMIYILMIFYL